MTTFTKLIEMQFARDGARTRFVGFVGELRDESNALIHSALYDDKPAAERALDALTHELLIDYAERGLVDTLPACDPPTEPRCANCAGAHFIQHCPELRALLMEAAPIRCAECGDVIDHPGRCPACQEDALIDRFGISLELRRRISIDAAERVAGIPF